MWAAPHCLCSVSSPSLAQPARYPRAFQQPTSGAVFVHEINNAVMAKPSDRSARRNAHALKLLAALAYDIVHQIARRRLD